MGSEHPIAGNKKSVLHVASRMILGKIKRFEIVVIVFDVRSARDFESHAPENIDNLVNHECQRMGVSSCGPRAGERDIDARFNKSLGFSLLLDGLEPAFQ